MSIKAAISKLDVEQKLSLTDEEKSDLLYSCRSAGLSDISDNKNIEDVVISQVKKLRNTKTQNPLTKKAKSALSIDECPICKGSMKAVSLAGGRKATYCATHKVVMPVKETEE